MHLLFVCGKHVCLRDLVMRCGYEKRVAHRVHTVELALVQLPEKIWCSRRGHSGSRGRGRRRARVTVVIHTVHVKRRGSRGVKGTGLVGDSSHDMKSEKSGGGKPGMYTWTKRAIVCAHPRWVPVPFRRKAASPTDSARLSLTCI